MPPTDSETMSNHDDLPEGISVLHRKPADHSVELALELARLGGSVKLVRAAGGQEAVDALHANGGPAGRNGANGLAAVGERD